jgi:hypothetical protein
MDIYPLIGAIVGVGIAAFGIVDFLKSAFPHFNKAGFGAIRKMVVSLTPETGRPENVLPQADILKSIEANWVGGTDVLTQKAAAKSLVTMHLTAENAAVVGARTTVDATVLASVAAKTASGIALTPYEDDVKSRFDVVVTALLDQAFEQSNSSYRHSMIVLSGCMCVLLAQIGGWVLNEHSLPTYLNSNDFWRALLAGVAAIPLAPLARDVSTAVGAAVGKKVRKALE